MQRHLRLRQKGRAGPDPALRLPEQGVFCPHRGTAGNSVFPSRSTSSQPQPPNRERSGIRCPPAPGEAPLSGPLLRPGRSCPGRSGRHPGAEPVPGYSFFPAVAIPDSGIRHVFPFSEGTAAFFFPDGLAVILFPEGSPVIYAPLEFTGNMIMLQLFLQEEASFHPFLHAGRKEMPCFDKSVFP